jgi:hypothetical protein
MFSMIWRNELVDYYYVTFFQNTLNGFAYFPTAVWPTLMVRGTATTHVRHIDSKSLFGPSYHVTDFGHGFFPHSVYLHTCIYNSQVCITASAFYSGFARERVTRRFLISHDSAGKVIIYRGQYTARELRVYWARYRHIAIHEKTRRLLERSLRLCW